MSEVLLDEFARVALAALECMEEALVVYDAGGCLVLCNPAFQSMYGYTSEEIGPGTHYRTLGEIDIRRGNVIVEDEEGEDYLQRKAEYRKALKGSFTVKLQDGRWIRTTDRAMPRGGFVSVHVDITELKEAQEKTRIAEDQARTDSLTGLYNRRAFFDTAESIHKAASRFEQVYSIMMIDIDRFKKVNDNYGHLAGDKAVKGLAEAVKKAARGSDISGRLGGDEFAVIMPNTQARDARLFAERLQLLINGASLPIDGIELKISASIGISEFRDGDDSIDQVISRADQALYRAKQLGRNRVEDG